MQDILNIAIVKNFFYLYDLIMYDSTFDCLKFDTGNIMIKLIL